MNSKKLLLFILVLLFTKYVHAQKYDNASDSIIPYIKFIQNNQMSAKDYIFSLFDKHDIVVICERHHRDTTQYDFYLDLINDPDLLKT